MRESSGCQSPQIEGKSLLIATLFLLQFAQGNIISLPKPNPASICGETVSRFHDLRHTFCTNTAHAGMDLKSLQYLMGHSNAGV